MGVRLTNGTVIASVSIETAAKLGSEWVPVQEKKSDKK